MKKSKKLLSLLLAVLMPAALMPVSALAAFGLLFKDVPRDAWYYPVVKTAYDRGITNGVTRTTFEPSATVTREQFLVMLYRAAEIDLDWIHEALSGASEEYYSEYCFADVAKDAWYTDVVFTAKNTGVTNGVDAVHFGIGQPITREQMATLAERFMEVRLHVALKAAEHPTAAFSDADQVSSWAKEAVEAMRVAGVLQGDDRNYVNPKAHATRAEATALILRLADATERVSFVPAETAWIRVINDTGMNVPRPRQTDIKDPETVQSMIRHLDNMPIDRETILPPSGGRTYELEFYDQQDQLLMTCRFDRNFIIVNASVLSTVLPYFLAWTLMN